MSVLTNLAHQAVFTSESESVYTKTSKISLHINLAINLGNLLINTPIVYHECVIC